MRIVSVWLDRWPIRRFLAAQERTPSSAPVDPQRPFVLAVEASGGPRVAALNEAAEAEGVALSEGVADARAKARGLQVRDLDPTADAAALARLALWATRYSPSAAPWGPGEGADGLFLEVAGAAHLFGGEAALLGDLRRRLADFGLPARAALAGTPGAAWALAHFGEKAATLVPPGQEEAALRPLPIEALRLAPATRTSLSRLGLKRIGDLLGQPRAPLSRRFGAGLLVRLDQVLGRSPEPIAWTAPPTTYGAARPFVDPLTAPGAIVGIARRLFEELCPALERDGVGARTLRLSLYRLDGETFCIDLGLAAPTRNPSYVERLLALRFERLAGAIDPGFGFETVRLDATAVEPLKPCQGTLASDGGDGGGERATALADGLSQRLGPGAVRRLWPVESHTPERAVAARSGAGRPEWPAADETHHDDELHHHGGNPHDAADHHDDHHDDAPPRPSLLLPRAEPAEVMAVVPDAPPRRFRWRGAVHRVAHAQGPERIAPEWWRQNSHQEKPQPTRDYFLVEDEGGRRFWLFREGLYGRETAHPRWFVHGFFP
jgi:protein ImuB